MQQVTDFEGGHDKDLMMNTVHTDNRGIGGGSGDGGGIERKNSIKEIRKSTGIVCKWFSNAKMVARNPFVAEKMKKSFQS